MDWFALIIWVLIGSAAMYIDITTSSFLFVWFTLGSVAAGIALLLNQSMTTQIITFSGVSASCLAVGYPIVKKTIKKTVHVTPTMEQNYIGREFVVDKNIKQKASIKFDGIYWTVKNVGNEISKGSKAKIVGIEGNKLLIEQIKND
jgi:membrane protein implicated in regulation of membrane protease activity